MYRMHPGKMAQFIDSDRWLQFVNSVSTGLQIGVYLFNPHNEFTLQPPGFCANCKTPFNEYSVLDRTQVYQEAIGSDPVRIVLSQGQVVAALTLSEDIIVVFSNCPCQPHASELELIERGRLAGGILASFLATLQENFQDSRRVVELSTLRQMNHIMLSLFRGDGTAVKRVMDLVLSAVIVLLDAQGAWLRINSLTENTIISKGEYRISEMDLQGNNQQLQRQPFKCETASGELGVVSPADSDQAQQLLQLMASECSIIIEVEHLFKMVQKRFTRVLHAIHSAVFIIDKRCTISYANSAALSFFGGPNPVGRSAHEIPGPWLKPLISGESSPVFGYMEPFYSTQDECRWIDWQLCALGEEDRHLGWVILADDRTDFHRWQQASRKSERFAATTSIVEKLALEMRNPLLAASGLLQLLRIKRDPGKVRDYTELIRMEIDRMTGLLDDFFLLGTPANISSTPIDLHSLLNELHPRLQGETAGTGIELIIDSKPCSPIWGDPEQLAMAVLNIVRNAISATTEPGPITMELREGPDYIEVSIRDVGTGISPEVKDSLFLPFITTRERSTGLGLTIAQSIVHNHGGMIFAADSPEGGAVFTIHFPKCNPELNGEINIDIMILVKDEIGRSLADTLRQSGFSAIGVADKATLALLSRHSHPRVVILDTYWQDQLDESLPTFWPDAIWLALDKFNKPPSFDSPIIDYANLILKLRQLLATQTY
ncbi:MAG: PAS domain-containing sensor histidine kinase [Syntrophomonas sp.]